METPYQLGHQHRLRTARQVSLKSKGHDMPGREQPSWHQDGAPLFWRGITPSYLPFLIEKVSEGDPDWIEY